MMSSNSRTPVVGRPYQWSKAAISHSAYGVSGEPRTRPGGGLAQVPCGSKKSILGGPNLASASYVSTGSLRTSIVQRMPANRCRYRSCVSRWTPATTAVKLPRPLAKRRCRSCACAVPSILTPTRTPSSSKRSRYSSSRPTAFVWMATSTRTRGPAASLVRQTRRVIRSRPASSGSPPCKVSETVSSRCARACSPILAAACPTISSGIRRGRSRHD